MLDDLNVFFDGSPFPWWEWNRETNKVIISPKKVTMIGYDPADFMDKGFEAYTALLHPDDYDTAMEAMRDFLSLRSPVYQTDYRILASNGSYHWYMDRGICLKKDKNGIPARIRGIVLDLGEHIFEKTPRDILIRDIRKVLPPTGAADSYVPVCSNCQKIRIDDRFLDASAVLTDFIAGKKTHTICPECIKALYPEFAQELLN